MAAVFGRATRQAAAAVVRRPQMFGAAVTSRTPAQARLFSAAGACESQFVFQFGGIGELLKDLEAEERN